MKRNLSFLMLSMFLILIVNLSVYSQRLVDNFEYANAEDSMARIDSFLIQLQNDPTATGYFILYGGKVNKKGEVDAHLKQIRNYLNFRKFDKDRIVFINGGFREKLSWEFWIVPFGEYIPDPTPTLDKKDVKIKGKFKSKKDSALYSCC